MIWPAATGFPSIINNQPPCDYFDRRRNHRMGKLILVQFLSSAPPRLCVEMPLDCGGAALGLCVL